MNHLRPATVAAVGPPLLALTFAAGTWVAMPNSRDLSSAGWTLAIGAVGGLAIFGPIAAMLALGQRRPKWLGRNAWRIGFYASMAMALALGYLAACIRHGVWDSLMLVASAILFLGAAVKASLGYALRQRRSNPG